jgi:predicted pyridoxine 5'-phosphate oxidase superfamily flavin-nucleotide-binding protein
MGHVYAQTMFTDAVRAVQEEHHSRAQYERLARQGPSHDALTAAEIDFIGRRDSFYLASVTSDGWPYVQHRGGPRGFLKVIDNKTLAFADYAGNKQYITAGNIATNDKVSLFLMDYPNQARLKMIGHARAIEPGDDPALVTAVKNADVRERVERILMVDLVAYDWNCSQYITPRYTEAEIDAVMKTSRG